MDEGKGTSERKKREAVSFEEAMKKLESIVEALGEGSLPLEDSLNLFEQGMGLCRFCSKKLDEAEYKVERLTEGDGEGEGGEEGAVRVEDFEVEG